MKVLDPGHKYQLETVDGKAEQLICFVKRIPNGTAPDTYPGVLMQEVIRVLIDRLFYLYAQVPCVESQQCILNLRECLVLLDSRAARRKIEKVMQIEREPACPQCGHVLCFCDRPWHQSEGIRT